MEERLLKLATNLQKALKEQQKLKETLIEIHKKVMQERIRLEREATQNETLTNEMSRKNYVNNGLLQLDIRQRQKMLELKSSRLENEIRSMDYEFRATTTIIESETKC